jgi:hypothetical protein
MRAALPDGSYEAPAAVSVTGRGSVVVEFTGEDGRHRSFDFAGCPLPGWHHDLAAVLAKRVGPGGGLRTSASAFSGAWRPLVLFLQALATAPAPPQQPGQLRVGHVHWFIEDRTRQREELYGLREVENVAALLRLEPIASMIATEVHSALRQRIPLKATAVAGYSDGELHRLVSAARSDLARIRKRLVLGEAALSSVDRPGMPAGPALDRARTLRKLALGGDLSKTDNVKSLAPALFVTRADLPPMLLLMVAVTGCNIETIKELPADHRVVEGRAVELRLTKRRRGRGHGWSETVTWEIGKPSQQLVRPGGLYLLLHRMMARSRALAEDPRWLWSCRHQVRRHRHDNPFRASMTAGVDFLPWVRGHRLLDDAGEPLIVSANRLRTSVEVRRTRTLGGHLPSAARSNTVPVLFRDYLRDDPTTMDWAQDVTTDAITDAEAAALAAHRRALGAHRGALTVLPSRETDATATATAWAGCRDHEHHPATGRACRASFLDCFHCGNCVITRTHLPRLLALLDALDDRRAAMAVADWWRRYGPAWSAIRHDILPRFTPEELELARTEPAPEALLDLVEAPWHRP